MNANPDPEPIWYTQFDVDGDTDRDIVKRLKAAGGRSVGIFTFDVGVRVQAPTESEAREKLDEEVADIQQTLEEKDVLEYAIREIDNTGTIDLEDIGRDPVVEPERCEYCGMNQATRYAVPVCVNHRLFMGHTCEECYTPPSELLDLWDEGTAEYEELSELVEAEA